MINSVMSAEDVYDCKQNKCFSGIRSHQLFSGKCWFQIFTQKKNLPFSEGGMMSYDTGIALPILLI